MKKAARKAAPKKATAKKAAKKKAARKKAVAGKKAATRKAVARKAASTKAAFGRGAERSAELAIAAAERANARDAATIAKIERSEGKSLVIVESPAKAKTLEKFLGRDYFVLASYGHVRDLPKSGLGVDIEHDFEPEYVDIEGKTKVLAHLRKAAPDVAARGLPGARPRPRGRGDRLAPGDRAGGRQAEAPPR